MVEYFFWAVSSQWGFGFQIWISFLGGWYSTGVVLELFRTGFVNSGIRSVLLLLQVTCGSVLPEDLLGFCSFLQAVQ